MGPSTHFTSLKAGSTRAISARASQLSSCHPWIGCKGHRVGPVQDAARAIQTRATRPDLFVASRCPWTRPFDNPIVPPKSKTLTTLKDAAAYIMKLAQGEAAKSGMPGRDRGALMAAEDRGPLTRVTSEMLLALHGAKAFPSTIHQRRNTGDGES